MSYPWTWSADGKSVISRTFGMTMRRKRLSFSPEIFEWNGPPPPPNPDAYKRKSKPKKGSQYSVARLTEFAEGLRTQSSQLALREPSLHMRLGLVLEGMGAEGSRKGSLDGIDTLLKRWDPMQKGEVSKKQMVRIAQHLAHSLSLSLSLSLSFFLFLSLSLCMCDSACRLCRERQRSNLRKVGLEVTNTKADSLFDSWDLDGNGVLNLNELRAVLAQARDEAQRFAATSSPAELKRQALLRHAELCEEAAVVVGHADELEAALEEQRRQINTRVDIQLGELLQKRMIKPGEVLTRFALHTASPPTQRLALHTSDTSLPGGGALGKGQGRDAGRALKGGLPPRRTRPLRWATRLSGLPTTSSWRLGRWEPDRREEGPFAELPTGAFAPLPTDADRRDSAESRESSRRC